MMDSMTASPMKPKHLNCPLMAGCSIGHKVSPLDVVKWRKKKPHKYMSFLFLFVGR